MWSPEQYHRYSSERSRPFFDLLAQVQLHDPRFIVDMGCGSGELTAVLAERWPGARVLGIDSSPEMIAEAQGHTIADRLTFEQADLTAWQPAQPLDLLFSNATLQWVGDHAALLSRLIDMIAPGGMLAFQVPGNFTAPSHTILAGLRMEERWSAKLGKGAVRTASVQSPEWYLEFLVDRGLQTEAWETTYMHVLQGENAVLEWVKGTALRPVLAALDDEEQREFLGEYAERLNEAYPPKSFGTIFPFRRIFVVGRKIED
jgi:trans-aconitate 2-methyltransferase